MIFLFFPLAFFICLKLVWFIRSATWAHTPLRFEGDPDADTDPDLDPDAHWRPLYIVSLLNSISDSESGSDLASHLRHNLACCIYRLLILFWVLFTHATLIKTKGTFALISVFSFQYIYTRFFHFYGFFDGWKTRRKKRLWKVCWLRRVAFCVWNFVCWNLCCLTLLFVSLTQSPEQSSTEQGRAHRALSSP